MKILKNVSLFSLSLLSILSCNTSENKLPKNLDSTAEVYIGKYTPVDSLKKVLEELNEKDQGIRKKLSEAINNQNSDDINKIIEEMNSTDSLNQVQVSAILEEYGWLEESKIGKKASGALFYVVQHAELPLMKKYFPQLKALAEKGEARKQHVAMMQDRIFMYENKKQLFGTQASNLVRKEQVSVIWPIENSQEVNKRRKEMGFQTTIEDYAESLGATYDPQEELPAENPWNNL